MTATILDFNSAYKRRENEQSLRIATAIVREHGDRPISKVGMDAIDANLGVLADFFGVELEP